MDKCVLGATKYKTTMRDENNCMHGQLGQITDKKIQKTKNPVVTSEKLGAKANTTDAPLHTTSPKGWANYLGHPSSPSPGHTPNKPTITLCKEPAHQAESPHPHTCSHPCTLELAREQGNLLFDFFPSYSSGGPSKGLLELLIWHLINFC